MKKTSVSLSLLAALSMTTLGVQASTGTITFQGELTDSTCDVDISGQGNNATVMLPTVSINQLTALNDTSGRTAFTMELSNCNIGAAGHSTVSAFFQPGATVDLVTGRLKNTGGNATNVDLQLLDASNSFAPIHIGDTSQVNGTAYVNISNGSAFLPYAVEYFALGQTTPGTVTSSVVYNLQYQ